MPFAYLVFVGLLRQKGITRVPIGSEPRDELNEIRLGHRRASRARPIFPAAYVKKYCAPVPRHRRIGIMPNLNQPSIGKIVMPHLLLLKPGRRMLGVRYRYHPVVVGKINIVDPRIGFRYLMKWVIRTRRQLGIVGIDFPDAKDSGRCAPIAFRLVQSRFALAFQAAPPGQTKFPEQNRDRRGDLTPGTSPRSLESLQFSPHRIPGWGESDNELATIVGHASGTAIAHEQAQPQRHEAAEKQIRHLHIYMPIPTTLSTPFFR